MDDREQLHRLYDRACKMMPADLLMVQEVIPRGGDSQMSFAALCVGGDAVASVVAERRRQYPMDFGRASTYVISVDAPDVAAAGRRLLARLGMTGLAEVEFKRHRESAALKLLDVNLRVWAWHTLGRRAGIDFPYLLWRTLNGLEVDRTTAPAGVRWMRLSTDLPTAVREIVAGRLGAGEYARSFAAPRERAMLATDDPLPGLVEGPSLALRVARRVALGELA